MYTTVSNRNYVNFFYQSLCIYITYILNNNIELKRQNYTPYVTNLLVIVNITQF